MTEIQQKIIDAVSNAGGECDWDTAIAGLDYPERRRALDEVRVLKQAGLIERIVAFTPNVGVSFTLKLTEGSS